MTFATTMMMKSIIGHRSVPSLFVVASKKRPIISRRCFLSITNMNWEMMIDKISNDDDMRIDAAYSLSLASDDSGFSPLSRDLNEREMEQLSISKNQLLHVLRQDDPVPVSLGRKQENNNNYSNYYRDDSTIISSIVSSSKSTPTQLNIFTAAHNSNLSKQQHHSI
jgi:hypothetical protein